MKRTETRWLNSLCLIVLAGLPTAAGALETVPLERPCAVMVKPPEKPVAPTAISRADPKKSKSLKKMKVKNQNQYGCCWISSDLGEWERQLAAKLGRPIKLSENYMILASLFFRVEEAVYYGNTIFQGGWVETADWMATQIGLAPESACHWKVDLRDKYVGNEILAFLNGEIADFQARLADLKAHGGTAKEAWDLGEKQKLKLMKYLRDRVGNFPTKFVVGGKQYTPNSFSKILVDVDKVDAENKWTEKWVRFKLIPVEPRINPAGNVGATIVAQGQGVIGLYPENWEKLPNAKKYFQGAEKPTAEMMPLFQLYGKSHVQEFVAAKAPLAEIHNRIVDTLDQGQSLFLGFFVPRDLIRTESGIMSIAAFGKTIEEAKKAKIAGGHAVLITGYYKDAEGNLLGFEIQNSWGKKVGINGYFQMDLDFFDTFMTDVEAHATMKFDVSGKPVVETVR